MCRGRTRRAVSNGVGVGKVSRSVYGRRNVGGCRQMRSHARSQRGGKRSRQYRFDGAGIVSESTSAIVRCCYNAYVHSVDSSPRGSSQSQ